MPALDPQYMAILKKVLAERFVPFLPALLDATKPAAEQQAKQLSRAFSAFVLHKLLDITPAEAAAAVVDDFNDKGIDAIHYDEDTETLYLLQTKLKESEQFKQEDALPFCEGVRLLLKQDFAAFNYNVQSRQTNIEFALDACSHIKLIVPYTGDGISKTASDAFQSLLDDEDLDEVRLEKKVTYYTATEIARDLLAEQAYQPVHTDIALQKYSRVEQPRTTYYGIARLNDLVALHRDKGKALYERNIRYFLGDRSDVNKAIKNTLKDDPGSFFYLNNGVTAVCDEIEQKGNNPASGFRKLKVRGLSIINGAQTVASAAEFVVQNPGSNIDDAKVMFTLIKAPADGTFGKRITRARNHQNPVQTSNFTSLDENQERLRQEIAHLGYSYHYRPEAAATGPTAISLDEVLRALASQQNDPRYAVWLKSDPGRLANTDSAEYQALFPGALSGVVLVNAVLCHRAIRALVVSYEQQAAARSTERLIYRHATHVISTAMMKRLRKRIGAATVIEPVAAIRVLISLPLDQLRQQTFDLGQQRLLNEGPLAYFRNQGNVVGFLADLMETNYALAADPVLPNLRNINNATDAYPRKRLLDYLSSKAPQL